jgi:hypothetical protein
MPGHDRAVVTVPPHNPPKPVLVGRCHDRTMDIDSDSGKFMDELVAWIATCVTSRSINPATGKPYHREFELVNKAFSDIKEIADYARRRPGHHTVHASYDWGRLNNGFWFVRGVHFSILGELLPPEIEPPDPVIKPPSPWIPGDTAKFADDIKDGNAIIDRLKGAVYQQAKKEAALPKNPIDPPSAKDLGDAFQDVVTTGEMPVAGFAKMILGDMFDVAAANMAGPVAKRRRRAYMFYIAGFVSVLAEQFAPPPADPFDKKYFNMGDQAARSLNPKQRYQVQLALMYYASQNPPSGWRIPQPLDWTFPDDYARNWSPERLAQALFIQLYQRRYSVD